jgi:hypothetical protein
MTTTTNYQDRDVMHAIRPAIFSLLAFAALAAGCSEPSGTTDTVPTDVNEYLAELPPWGVFSPTLPSQAPTAVGDPVALPEDTLDVERVQQDGAVNIVPDVVYSCTETPYTLRENPTQLVMYSPDVDILWPGALIQGRSHRDGVGALLGLNVQQRAPLRVSIPALPTGDNFREIERPNQSNVGAARGEMIGNATTANLPTPSTITFTQTVTHSEEQLALSMGLSGRYLGFSAKASADFNRDASETTVTAQFTEKMYEVVVAPPQTPGALFSPDFSKARLDEQVAAGNIGPDNIPVYVSTVVYGRMLMFSLTSTASEQEIRSTISATYEAIAGGVSATLKANHREILSRSRISVTSYGGPAEATLALIRSGDLGQYFTQNAPLSTAAPLSYTFKNLSDGSTASVTEPTNYTLKQCTARAASPGSYEFRELQSGALGIPTPVRAFTGDLNADGKHDMFWNHLGGTNQVRVGISNGLGGFTMSDPVTHPETPSEGWGNYTAVLGDYNGDGRTDIAWTHLSSLTNKTYLGLSNGDGTFGFPSVRIHGTGFAGWSTLAGDVNDDGSDDLIWNLLSTTNVVRSAISNGVSDFTVGNSQTHPNGGWGSYRGFVGDVDADQDADLIWGSGARTYFGLSNGSGGFTLSATPLDHPSLGAIAGYVRLVGDVNGDNRTDVIWADTVANGTNRIGVALSTGAGLTYPAIQNASHDATVALRVRTADVNADGRTDLVWNTTGNVNRVYVSLGKADGTFDTTVLSQLNVIPVTDWEQFSMLLADVSGDGRAEIIWNHAAATNRLAVGVARQP